MKEFCICAFCRPVQLFISARMNQHTCRHSARALCPSFCVWGELLWKAARREGGDIFCWILSKSNLLDGYSKLTTPALSYISLVKYIGFNSKYSLSQLIQKGQFISGTLVHGKIGRLL